MPVYPSLYVLAGAVMFSFRRRVRWVGLAAVGALIWGAVDSVIARRHYLAYFGPQAGGADEGYHCLVDSSLDWGMNLPALKEWLDANNAADRAPVFLAYFGTDDPEYHGIKSHRLPGFFDWRSQTPYALRPGLYAISATLYQGVYVAAFGRWNATYERLYRARLHNMRLFEQSAADPALRAELLRRKPPSFWEKEYRLFDHFRFARLCAWLRQQGDPPHHVGHSIFIWKLDQTALQAALFGPPAELADPPEDWRRLLQPQGNAVSVAPR